jgi:predicted  nucleic acid-binding Zn-ribbon protein
MMDGELEAMHDLAKNATELSHIIVILTRLIKRLATQEKELDDALTRISDLEDALTAVEHD